MTLAELALVRAATLLAERLRALEIQLEAGEDPSPARARAEARHPKTLADELGFSVRTLARKTEAQRSATTRKTCLESIRSAELHLGRLREDLAALEALAVSRRDLRHAARAETLRTTPVVVPERPVEELVRVRVCGQFATDYERLLYVGNPGDVHDLPLGLVERLGDRLVRVSPDTPLHLFQPVVEPRP